jgi:hypothetical protein
MSSLRPLIGVLALTALLAARSVPEAAEAYVLCTAASVVGAENPCPNAPALEPRP